MIGLSFGAAALGKAGGGNDRPPMFRRNDAGLLPLPQRLRAHVGEAGRRFGTAKALYDIIDLQGHAAHIREDISHFNGEAQDGKKLPVTFGDSCMSVRDDITAAMKSALKAGEAERLSAIRLIMAKLKDADIAARPRGVDRIPDEEALALLRGMIKPRREAIELYEKGGRPELAAKEQAEIAVIEAFLPRALNEEEMRSAAAAAVAAAGATSPKDMGRVMAALKAQHGAALDMARIGAIVKEALAG
jgi:uncharacterized protein YqeY